MIPRPEEGSEDPLIEVRIELESLLEDGRTRSKDLPPELEKIEAKYKAKFAHCAEFWLLLGIAHRIAAPLPIYGHYASSYFGHAESCTDIDDAAYEVLLSKCMHYLIEQLEARAQQRTRAQMSDGKAKEYSLAAARFRFSLEDQQAPSSSQT